MRRITKTERRWFIAMVETILPSGASETFPLGASDVPLSSFLDDFLRHAPTKIVLGLRLTLLLIFVAPLFMGGLRRTFSGLNAEQREAAILRMRRSDVYVLRELPVLLKTIGCMAVLGVPDVQKALGLAAVDPTPPSWVRGEALDRGDVAGSSSPSPGEASALELEGSDARVAPAVVEAASMPQGG